MTKPRTKPKKSETSPNPYAAEVHSLRCAFSLAICRGGKPIDGEYVDLTYWSLQITDDVSGIRILEARIPPVVFSSMMGAGYVHVDGVELIMSPATGKKRETTHVVAHPKVDSPTSSYNAEDVRAAAAEALAARTDHREDAPWVLEEVEERLNIHRRGRTPDGAPTYTVHAFRFVPIEESD